MRVAVLSGGQSSEHDVSLASGAAVRTALMAAGHDVIDLLITRDGGWLADGAPVTLVPAGGLLGVDVAFPVLHGPYGEDGTVQGLLELLDVPYVGAGVLASALCMDKVVFKDVMAAAGVPQVPYRAFRHDDDVAILEPLGFPVFVKPARAGSSIGIVKVTEAADLQAAIDTAFQYDSLLIVEAMSTGLEVEIAVLGNAAPLTSSPGEIVLGEDAEWYDYEAKYSEGGMRLEVPARISTAAAADVARLAADTFIRVGCTGLARVDFFVEGDRVIVNELNTMPGFTPTSVYASLWAESGMAFEPLCDRLLDLALERFGP